MSLRFNCLVSLFLLSVALVSAVPLTEWEKQVISPHANASNLFKGYYSIVVLVITGDNNLYKTTKELAIKEIKKKGFTIITKEEYDKDAKKWSKKLNAGPTGYYNIVLSKAKKGQMGCNAGYIHTFLQTGATIDKDNKGSILTVWDDLDAFPYKGNHFDQEALENFHPLFCRFLNDLLENNKEQKPLFFFLSS